MDDDLLEQLRTRHIKLGYELPTESLFSAAADELERLNAENARLREALAKIANNADQYSKVWVVETARAALAEKEST